MAVTAQRVLMHHAVGRHLECPSKGLIDDLTKRSPVFETCRAPRSVAAKYLLGQCRAKRQKGETTKVATACGCFQSINPFLGPFARTIDSVTASSKSMAANSTCSCGRRDNRSFWIWDF